MTEQEIKQRVINSLKGFSPEITQEKIKGKTDSLFYEGDIAEVLKPNGTRLTLIATGDIKIRFGEEFYDNGNIQDFIDKYNLDDKKLEKMNEKNKINWENNNWFEVVWIKKGEDYTDSDMGITADNYEEAIELLQSYYENDEL